MHRLCDTFTCVGGAVFAAAAAAAAAAASWDGPAASSSSSLGPSSASRSCAGKRARTEKLCRQERVKRESCAGKIGMARL